VVYQSVRLTTLTDNTTGQSGLLAEHGLSILVEVGGHRILLDTGATYTALHNARSLGIDLTSVEAIVLSHGHYDHTGGLKAVLRELASDGREVPVIAHPDLWSARYSRRGDGRPTYAGIPFLREEMESMGARFRLSRQPVEVVERVWTTGEVPLVTPFEQLDHRLVVRDGADWRQDELADDLALIVSTEMGLVVVAGCAHRGIVNTVAQARRVTGETRVYAVVGGTHLSFAPEAQVARTAKALRESGVQRLGVSHCTGLPAAARLAHEFGDAFFFNSAGTSIELPVADGGSNEGCRTGDRAGHRS